ncbi:tetratricopeptide repeat protein [Novosphingobium bradum]|uniref:Tetratricopeptide repeat protein n=1 Tax=Novosphingobium bradum TaxID=1737444 RepID=A0ABV7IUD5_9SPHN
MISTPDRPLRRWLAGLALALLAAVPGQAGEGAGDAALRAARGALARGDGIAGEAALREALAASDAAFARALAIAPRDSRVWVDIARLRYVSGQELAAVDAADQAVRLDPGDVRALELRGLLVRDRFGLKPALSWLEAGLKRRPDDLALLGEYAATLGELGRAREALVVTRKMIRLAPRDPRAWLVQATLAARAGDYPLARQMLGRAGPDGLATPAALLLSGVLELEAANTNLAVERLDLLARRQPRNAVARDLLARAMAGTGNPALVIARFADEVAAPGTSAYLLILVARAYEDSGRRDLAAPLLDRAADFGPPGALGSGATSAQVIAEPTALGVLALRYGDAPGDAGAAVPYVRKLLAGGDLAGAGAVAERIAAAAPASASAQALAGDVRLLRGNLTGAVEGYRRAAAVRLSDDLMLRLVEAYLRSGQGGAARRLVSGVLATTPRNRTALRLAAGFAAQDGNWVLAVDVLHWLAITGDGRDARLMADLAIANARAGRDDAALLAAQQARLLQRAAAHR